MAYREGITSIGRKLQAQGFKQTTLARAVTEYIESLFGAHKNPSAAMFEALQGATQKKIEGVVPAVQVPAITVGEVTQVGDSAVSAVNDATPLKIAA